ncbi:MAG: DUF423 domain-containing protein [Pedobacter sp.]|nr:MAG: DUF423 domain-containing protein [Pedobacter sp.]
MNKNIILTASIFGALAVGLGAFGAHSLKDLIEPRLIDTWAKGVEYQFYHTLAILYLSTFARYKNNLIKMSYLFFSLGIILFSGSLYLLATQAITELSFVNYIGPITPIGGLCLILGWVFLFLAAFRHK